MDLFPIFSAIESSAIATWVRDTIRVLPLINGLHVIGLALVFGTITIVDLRLLGIPSNRRPITVIAKEMLPWTWIAFVIAVITGLLMFAANATTFYVNTQFQIKMVLLALAGLNMAVFELLTMRSVADWDRDKATPRAARAAGAASIVLWAAVIVMGRWIGYTKGFNFDVPVEMDLENLFGSLAAHLSAG